MAIPDVLLGAFLGLFGAGVLTALLLFLHWAQTQVLSFFRRQVVPQPPVITRRTPFQVFCGCLLGAGALALFILAVFFLVQEIFYRFGWII